MIQNVATGSPRVAAMRVIPVAGRDSMLLNLSGAHGPFFTRNLVALTDDAGRCVSSLKRPMCFTTRRTTSPVRSSAMH